MRGRKYSAVITAAVMLLAAALMLARFASAERSGRELSSLPASQLTTGTGHPAREGQININTASEEELDLLPGIGPVKAAAIVAWRTENGGFRYPEELILVHGIGEGTLAKLLDMITTGGE